MLNQTEIRDDVTRRIIQALESNVLPWRRPWQATGSQPGRHSNVVTGKPYQGVNPILLEMHAFHLGLTSRWWGTFNQWHDLGCRVMRRPANVEEGHWGCKVTYWKSLTKAVLDEEHYILLRTFTVFNADQVEGDFAEQLRVRTDEGHTNAVPDYAPAEELIAATKADIRHGGERAYYAVPTPEGSFPHHTGGDFVVVPPKQSFATSGAFYETVLHELAHWSEVRTGRDRATDTYALGELIAEIASCYVVAELGIPQGEGIDNHAAYLQHWLTALRADRNFIFTAAKQANKVTDYLLGFVRKPELNTV